MIPSYSQRPQNSSSDSDVVFDVVIEWEGGDDGGGGGDVGGGVMWVGNVIDVLCERDGRLVD